MLEIQIHRKVRLDVENLDNFELQLLAKSWFKQLTQSTEILGKPLGRVKGIGNLSGYWAVKFDLPGFHNRYRMVFQYRPNSINPLVVYILAVGPRFGYRVYRDAVGRISK